jgi:hypothetical protein
MEEPVTLAHQALGHVQAEERTELVDQRALPPAPIAEVVGEVADRRPASPEIGAWLDRRIEEAVGLLDSVVVDRLEHCVERLISAGRRRRVGCAHA